MDKEIDTDEVSKSSVLKGDALEGALTDAAADA